MILKGNLASGDSSESRKAHGKQVLLSKVQNQWHQPIIFTHEDKGVTFPYEDVHKLLVDDGSIMNILSEDTMTHL